MDVYEALYTTRAMRRCRPDKIPIDVQQRILDAAVRAPTGGNTQNWRFMLVDDAKVLAALGPIYRECLALLWETIYKERVETALADPDTEESKQMLSIQRSAQHLADHFEEYPLLLFSFVQFDPTGGSIFPATWSAMLAARAEGVGSSLTSVFMFQIDKVLEILGVPKEGGWLFSSCVTMGYPTGVWGVAKRRPAHEVSYRNRWGTDVGFEIDKPLVAAELIRDFELVEAALTERPVLRRLVELYCYDFSGLTGDDVNVHGEFGYRWLDHYFTEPDRVPFLLRVDGRWAGFALVRSGDVNDMAEFFVMRKYRRTGVGRIAAQQLFARFAGAWTVRQVHANPDATTFWRGVIPYVFEESSTDTHVIQQFDSSA